MSWFFVLILWTKIPKLLTILWLIKLKNSRNAYFVIVFMRHCLRKPHDSKKSTFSDRLEMFFFWKPISSLVIWQIFRIFGHSLADWQGLEGSLWPLKLAFFEKVTFSLKMVPFPQFLTETNDSNTHFRAFFMLYTNQIT